MCQLLDRCIIPVEPGNALRVKSIKHLASRQGGSQGRLTPKGIGDTPEGHSGVSGPVIRRITGLTVEMINNTLFVDSTHATR